MTRAKSGQAQADNAEVIRLTSDEINHKKLRIRKLHRFTILHYSPFKALWDWFVLLLVVYTAIFTPYSVAFLLRDDQKRSRLNKEAETRSQGGPSESYTDPLVIIDLIVDVMFIVDIFINFRTTFIDEQKGEVESNPAKIAKHYLKGWFVIDVLSAVPFDLLMFGLATDERTTTAMGLLKTARLLRLLRVLRRVDDYSQYAPAVVILLMCAFSLVAHWLACVWYAIGEAERSTISHGWLGILADQTDQPYRNDSTAGPSLESRYLTSLYFTLTTLTTVGFGNVAPNTDFEKLFTIIIMLVGSSMFAINFGNMTALNDRLYEGIARYHQHIDSVEEFVRFYNVPVPLRIRLHGTIINMTPLMFAVIFGNLTALITRLYEKMSQYQTQMDLIKEFVSFHNVPSALKVRLEEYFKYAYIDQKGTNASEEFSEVMADFPDFLQADISLHLNRNLLRSSTAFQGVNQGCLRALSMRLQTTHTAPGDILIHKGDKLNVMYFISRGSLEILQGNIVVAILGKNDVVGENFCIRPSIGRSKGTVRALTYCDLLALSRNDLEDMCTLYPEFREHFAEKVEVTIEMTDEDSDAEMQPMIPESRDPEAANSSDQSGLPRKKRVGADLHTRVTLAPMASKENATRKPGEPFFKGNRQNPMLFLQMQIARGHMAQENVKTVQVSMEDIPTIMEENNNGDDDDECFERSDGVKSHRQRKPKHVNFHPSTTLTSPTSPDAKANVRPKPNFVYSVSDIVPPEPDPATGAHPLGTTSADAAMPRVAPRVIMEEIAPTGEGVHRRIDGLYNQLNTIESKFEEQREAIIDFILFSSQGAHGPARYRGGTTPDDSGLHSNQNTPQLTAQEARSVLHDRGENQPTAGAVDQVPLVTLPPASSSRTSAPPGDNVPSYHPMQLQNTNGPEKYNKSTPPRPGRRKSPSSGYVSTANWNERSPGRAVTASSPASNPAAREGANDSDDQPIWHERTETDGSKSSSTDC